MKKMCIYIVVVLVTAIFSNVYGQGTPPPGAGDRDLRDNNVRSRSNELERIDREARQNEAKKNNPSQNSTQSAEDRLAVKYDEIKNDFELIQQSQSLIIDSYTKGEKINYAQISKSSQDMNKSAMRLNSNLFPVAKAENPNVKKDDKMEKTPKTPKSVRDMIIDLDNTIGSFTASSMFQNLRVVDTEVSEKARLDLEKIIELSLALNAETQKITNGGK